MNLYWFRVLNFFLRNRTNFPSYGRCLIFFCLLSFNAVQLSNSGSMLRLLWLAKKWVVTWFWSSASKCLIGCFVFSRLIWTKKKLSWSFDDCTKFFDLFSFADLKGKSNINYLKRYRVRDELIFLCQWEFIYLRSTHPLLLSNNPTSILFLAGGISG